MKKPKCPCFIVLGILMSLFVSSCKNKMPVEGFTPFTTPEVYNVVNAVVSLVKLDTSRFNKNNIDRLLITDSLASGQVYFETTIKRFDGTLITPPPPPGLVGYHQLILESMKFFSSRDSLFFGYQNKQHHQFVLKQDKFTQLKISRLLDYERAFTGKIHPILLTLTIPVFSADHNKATFKVFIATMI